MDYADAELAEIGRRLVSMDQDSPIYRELYAAQQAMLGALPSMLQESNYPNHGHSGRLRRLSGCSPSASAFRYLFPDRLVAIITRTV